MFGINNYFFSFKKLEAIPTGTFGPNDLKGCLENKFVDVFKISEGQNSIVFIDMVDLFKEDGILEAKLIDYFEDYVNNKAIELGVEIGELEAVLVK